MIIEVIYLLAIAVLSIMIAYHSTLADQIKSLIKLDITSQPLIKKLSKIKFWNKLIRDDLKPYLWPLMLILTLYFKLHYLVLQMINCPYCLGFHLTWITFTFHLNYSLLISLVIALVNIITIGLVKKIIDE